MIDRAIFESLQAKIDEEAAVRDVRPPAPTTKRQLGFDSTDTDTVFTGAPRYRAESLEKRFSNIQYIKDSIVGGRS